MPGFDAVVRASGRGSHALVVPPAVVVGLTGRRVVAQIGPESFEATLGSYGGRTFLGLRTALLIALGAAAGDTVHVELASAPGGPTVVVDAGPASCAVLESALNDDEVLAAAWRALPEGHRDEYGRWVSGAPDPVTQRARIARMRHRLASA